MESIYLENSFPQKLTMSSFYKWIFECISAVNTGSVDNIEILCRIARFFLIQYTKKGEIYQMDIKYIKWR
jgi:hypothetical protein